MAPLADWREQLRSDVEDLSWRPRPSSYVLSMTPESLPEIDRMLPEKYREEFWSEVLDLEVERRLGMLDWLVPIPGRHVKLDAEYRAAVGRAAEWLPGSNASAMEEQEIAAGMSLLGERAAGLTDTLCRLALSGVESTRERAQTTLRELGAAASGVLPVLEIAFRSGTPQRSHAALEALACLRGEFPALESGLGVSELVLQVLRDADASTLAAIVDFGSGYRPGCKLLEAIVAATDVEPELLRWIDLEIAASNPHDRRDRRATAALRCVPALRQSWRKLLPLLLELASAPGRRSEAAARALKWLPFGAEDAAALDAAWEHARNAISPSGEPPVQLWSLALKALEAHSGSPRPDEDAIARYRDHLADRLAKAGWTGPYWSDVLALTPAARERLAAPEPFDDFLAALLEADDTRAFALSDHLAEVLPMPRVRAAIEGAARKWPSSDLTEKYCRLLGPGAAGLQLALLHGLSTPDLHPWDRARLVSSLSRLADASNPGPMAPLLDLFCDPSEDGRVRCAAAEGIARAGLPASLAPPVEQCLQDPRACVRAWALLLLPDDSNGERVRSAEGDPSVFVRFVAKHRERLMHRALT
jgi:hypothetical protein